MDRDFFIKLTFATHKVAGLLPAGDAVKKDANQLLADLLLFSDENPVTVEQKRNILPRTLRQVAEVLSKLRIAKGQGGVDEKSFLILQKEYGKIPQMLTQFLADNKKDELQPSLSVRQQKIVELLKNKEQVQVWELQKIMPEVTKRTLRRDLDELLQFKLIERAGEWNSVFYRLKK